ncbi:translation initiation factor IF-2-like [Physeter macrocephalus]|uniref:Translation initiation factor IF-2-like n=1 Tax=Physeter macrocephalus TaxID=9755 RepID=A0A455BJY4_PHYMC|nr:translation initiation factor IF-2-like [Physeter catodon]|eukprot:XP_028348198.1 uncharacterized protein LOC114486630 [Physeter catodon]
MKRHTWTTALKRSKPNGRDPVTSATTPESTWRGCGLVTHLPPTAGGGWEQVATGGGPPGGHLTSCPTSPPAARGPAALLEGLGRPAAGAGGTQPRERGRGAASVGPLLCTPGPWGPCSMALQHSGSTRWSGALTVAGGWARQGRVVPRGTGPCRGAGAHLASPLHPRRRQQHPPRGQRSGNGMEGERMGDGRRDKEHLADLLQARPRLEPRAPAGDARRGPGRPPGGGPQRGAPASAPQQRASCTGAEQPSQRAGRRATVRVKGRREARNKALLWNALEPGPPAGSTFGPA